MFRIICSKSFFGILTILTCLSILLLGGGLPLEAQSGDARPLEGQALDNVVAFTHLSGYVRFFHPSDQAASLDWDRFVIENIEAVENAEDATELAQVLQAIFAPMAPTILVFPTEQDAPSVPDALYPPEEAGALHVVYWQHTGFDDEDSPYNSNSYHSERRYRMAPGGELLANSPNPAEAFYAELGGGVACLVPMALYADATGTLPYASTEDEHETPLPAVTYSGDERATRLGDVALVWNPLRFFYPYFDVVTVDWEAVLHETLADAATAPDARAFLDVLRQMVARLDDGHGGVVHDDFRPYFVPPFVWNWIENQLTVIYVLPEAEQLLHPGDVILSINGVPVEEAIAAQERYVSAATDRHRRYLTLRRNMLQGESNSVLVLEVQRPVGDGPVTTITVQRTIDLREHPELEFSFFSLLEPRPQPVEEMLPGVFYIDVSQMDEISMNPLLAELQGAEGIIFDLRRSFHGGIQHILSRISDQTIESLRFCVPLVTYPGQQNLEDNCQSFIHSSSGGPFLLDTEVVFLINETHISYAETIISLIDHHDLGLLVGGPTGGTNGNMSRAALPGGYRVYWTGMVTLNYDGSQFHGIGIWPDVPAVRTIAGVSEGRDEVIERAVEVIVSD